ncbi:44123_t:CDS:2, partial [Gigaspora margarita]
DSTLNHASSEFSPEIDEWVTTYLTPSSLSIQLIDFQDSELQFDSIEQLNLSEQSNITGQYDLTESDTIDIYNLFAEDAVDVPESQTWQHPFIIGLGD